MPINRGNSVTASSNSISGVQINPNLARFLRPTLMLLALLVVIATIGSAFIQYNQLVSGLNEDYADALGQLGISASFLAGYITITDLIITSVFMLVGALVFARRSTNLAALLGAISLFLLGGTFFTSLNDLFFIYPIAGIIVLLFFYIFPDGTFIPRWYIIVFGAMITLYLVFGWNFIPSFLPGQDIVGNNLPLLVYLAVPFAGQVYRYYFKSNPVQQQQSKWVLIGIVCMLLAFLFTIVVFALFPEMNIRGSTARALYFLTVYPIRNAIICVLAFCFAFAILHYRLWDVGLVINRSLVYGSVIALALIIFFSVIVSLQVLFGQTRPVTAMVVSLVIAALIFRPLTRYLQTFVDRYVYGFRFDLNELNAVQRPQEITNPGLLTGTVIEGYELLGVLGKGGMGEIYRGFKDGQMVAIKTMLPKIAQDNDMRKRFEREAQAGIQLDHPNIAKVFASGEQDGTPYLIMEYIEGQDLKDYLKNSGKLDTETTAQLMKDICNALSVAHENGFIHRDLKPANIMIQPDGSAILMDFGITKMTDASSSLTGTGAIGTIDYMAPEQIAAAKHVDHRADIYSLGIILYEMLVGEKPFTGNAAQILFAHLQQPPPDARKLNPDLPEHISEAIQQAMAKSVDDRFQSVDMFLTTLISSAF